MDGIPGEPREEPITQTWAQFFPRVPKSEREIYAYPLPTTAEFWKEYAEPMELFWKTGMSLAMIHQTLFAAKGRLSDKHSRSRLALTLSDLIEVIRPNQLDDKIRKKKKEEERGIILKELEGYMLTSGPNLYKAVWRLNHLVQSVKPALTLRSDGFDHKWFAASLMSTLGMMMIQDLAGAATLMQCPVDGKVFLAQAESRVKYCSRRCLETAKKRGQRSRKAANPAE
jgi:hypothetical protein